ncbi:MAG: hypothetical protein KIT10_14410 [Flavobacteriales bacterium]|nr:hypothetical protein [Flavobacteriales bacterium]
MKTKLIPILLAVTLLAACSSFDASKVQEGMTAEELVAAVGEPDAIEQVMFLQVYRYGSTGVVMERGRVSSIEADWSNRMKGMEQGRKAVREALQEADIPAVQQPEAAVKIWDLSAVYTGMDADTLMHQIGEPTHSRKLSNGAWWFVYGDRIVEVKKGQAETYEVARIMPFQAATDSLNLAEGIQ